MSLEYLVVPKSKCKKKKRENSKQKHKNTKDGVCQRDTEAICNCYQCQKLENLSNQSGTLCSKVFCALKLYELTKDHHHHSSCQYCTSPKDGRPQLSFQCSLLLQYTFVLKQILFILFLDHENSRNTQSWEDCRYTKGEKIKNHHYLHHKIKNSIFYIYDLYQKDSLKDIRRSYQGTIMQGQMPE